MFPPDRPLRVCHILASTSGGAWMVEQLRELRDRHGCVVAAVVTGHEGSLIDPLNAAGIPFHVVRFSRLRHAPWAVARLVRVLKRERFDVVQTHVFPTMLVGRFAAWIAGCPGRFAMIAGPFHLRSYSGRWVERATAWMETSLIPSCDHSRDLLRQMGIPAGRIGPVVYYGVDERKFDPASTRPAGLRAEYNWPAGTPIVACVALFYGTFGPRRRFPPELWGRHLKGHDTLIRAAARVLGEFPGVRFVLVGAGHHEGGHAEMAGLRALVAELGLEDRMAFTGYRTDVAEIYADVDISVQASLSENLGGSLESLIMERPMVATRVGGLPDAVIDGATGVLVDPGDPASLAGGILRLLRDPATAKSMGVSGRALVLDRFTLATTARELDRLYRTALQSSTREYRGHVTVWRAAIATAVGAAVSLRLVLIDELLLRAWDVGWGLWRRRSSR